MTGLPERELREGMKFREHNTFDALDLWLQRTGRMTAEQASASRRAFEQFSDTLPQLRFRSEICEGDLFEMVWTKPTDDPERNILALTVRFGESTMYAWTLATAGSIDSRAISAESRLKGAKLENGQLLLESEAGSTIKLYRPKSSPNYDVWGKSILKNGQEAKYYEMRNMGRAYAVIANIP